MDPARDPLLDEWLEEFVEALSAVCDAFRALLETPVNAERMGHALDRLDAVRDAVREMRDQEGMNDGES